MSIKKVFVKTEGMRYFLTVYLFFIIGRSVLGRYPICKSGLYDNSILISFMSDSGVQGYDAVYTRLGLITEKLTELSVCFLEKFSFFGVSLYEYF